MAGLTQSWNNHKRYLKIMTPYEKENFVFYDALLFEAI